MFHNVPVLRSMAQYSEAMSRTASCAGANGSSLGTVCLISDEWHDRISLRPTYTNNVGIIMRRSQNYRPLRERHRVAVLRNRVTPLSVLSLAHVCRRPCNRFSFINNAHTKFHPLRIMIFIAFIIYDYERINNYLYLRRRKKK